jgi:hypothetical protein
VIADLLPTRLYWVGLRGLARMNGREVALSAPPDIGTTLEALDYAPGEVAVVMPRREGWRDMTAEEVAAARRLLEQLTAEVKP